MSDVWRSPARSLQVGVNLHTAVGERKSAPPTSGTLVASVGTNAPSIRC